MKSMRAITLELLLVTGFAVMGCSSEMSSRGDTGWITLLDGSNSKSLENWNRLGDANWRIEDGAIVADKGKGGHLLSKNSYKNFQLRAEFWADHTTNSGIFFRISDPKQIGSKTAYEANIYDQRPEPEGGTGAIPNVANVPSMPKAGGKWNTYEITAKGSHLIVVFNGTKTVDVQHAQFTEGPISLQFSNREKGSPGGPIKWRRVQIRPL
jgi:3-keto-disaccharide hydrolase